MNNSSRRPNTVKLFERFPAVMLVMLTFGLYTPMAKALSQLYWGKVKLTFSNVYSRTLAKLGETYCQHD